MVRQAEALQRLGFGHSTFVELLLAVHAQRDVACQALQSLDCRTVHVLSFVDQNAVEERRRQFAAVDRAEHAGNGYPSKSSLPSILGSCWAT